MPLICHLVQRTDPHSFLSGSPLKYPQISKPNILSKTHHLFSFLVPNSLLPLWYRSQLTASSLFTTALLNTLYIVVEAGIKTIPKENKCKKAKWLSEEVLQIAVNRRKVKGKGEKERYTHLNAELQRIARRDKKAFLSDQCKEIEENNRMGKTRDLFKKTRDTNGIFHV